MTVRTIKKGISEKAAKKLAADLNVRFPANTYEVRWSEGRYSVVVRISETGDRVARLTAMQSGTFKAGE